LEELTFLLNNAGILRDISFQKMKDQDWDIIFKVHVYGAYKCTKAALEYHEGTGLWQNHQHIFSCRTLWQFRTVQLFQLPNCLFMASLKPWLKKEKKKNIRVNTIAPLAASRMLETVMPP
jgi:multifunctional beta-oxidation protein